jgi:predicted dehydrogenase
MLRVGVVGLGKMGLTHYALINAHPRVTVEAVCDSAGYLLSTLNKYTGVRTFSDFDAMLRDVELDAVLIATPPSMHAGMARAALNKGLHVFCEKPFCLSTRDGEEVARLAQQKGLVTQVGYHYRFVGAFQEVKRLMDVQAIGDVTHILAEAYGPLLLQPKGTTWRTQRSEGGGCLYDYAAHPINLVNWYFGLPSGVGGSVLNGVFSQEDEVFSTLYFRDSKSAQISVTWSDESCRRMTTKLTIWGKAGRIFADRQECQVYLRDTARVPETYRQGWNSRYTTDLTEPVWFYIRGEEFSAQLDHFVTCIENKSLHNVSSFASAVETDKVISMIMADAAKGASVRLEESTLPEATPPKKRSLLSWPRPASRRPV